MSKSKFVVPDGNLVEFIEPFEDRNLFGKLNKACAIGIIKEEFKYSHEYSGIKYYKTVIESKRASGVIDRVPIIINDKQLESIKRKSFVGKFVEIAGRYRSYRIIGEDNKVHLEFALLAAHIEIIKGDDKEDTNVVCLEGVISKVPVLRDTPNGRVITDFFLKVPKSYTKADFIPCIAWEEIGRYVYRLKPGDKIKIFGRIQSRKYMKKCTETSQMLTKETYEISIWRLKRLYN